MFGVIELLNPPAPEIEETPEQRHWLLLADIALRLDEARKEQKKIKQKIRPNVEKYKRITGKSK
jgi:hypothetical protein